MKLGDTIKHLRIFNGLSIKQISNELKISESYLSEIENNKKSPSIKIIEKLAYHFNMSISDILKISEKINKENYFRDGCDKKSNTRKLNIFISSIYCKF